MWLLYVCFSLGLYIWTIKAIPYSSPNPQIEYLLGISILLVFVLVIWITDSTRKVRIGITIVSVFINIGLSIAYRMVKETEGEYLNGIFQDGYTRDLVVMLVVYMIIYFIVKYTRIYKCKFVNQLALIFIPITIYGARLSGRMVGGSYLYFLGIMIFGSVLLTFPFVAAYFLTQDENKYINGSVKTLPKNLTLLLIYTFVLYLGCVLCNEFGLLLIIALTTTTLFFIRCKNTWTKMVYSIACIVGAMIACLNIAHLEQRIQIWLNPSATFGNDILGIKAESVLYLFRHIYKMGWYGNGIGTLPKSIYPTLNTDHVIISVMNDYGALMTAGVIILSILFVKWMLIYPECLCNYDRYLNLSCALIVGFIILVHVSSNLGSFITAGIGFPYISEGSSFNIMITGLLAIHNGLLGKRVSTYDQNEI